MVRVAIVGCGRFAEAYHMRQYRDLGDRVKLVGFVDSNEERSRLLQKAAGTGQVYRDARELPGPDQVDYVDVCVPHRLHLPVGLALLEAGHNVLLEKPMALSTRECDELISAAERKKARLGVGIHTRFHPSLIAAREFIRAGSAGRPLFASATFRGNLASFHKGGGAVSDWRGSAEGAGGALPDLGIYVADIFLWTFGDALLVQAMRVPHGPSDPPGGERGSEMTSIVTVELEGGLVGSFLVTWDYPGVKLPPSLDPKGIFCETVCEGGILVVPDPVQGHPAVFYPAGEKAPIFLSMPKVEPELSQVVTAIEKGQDFPITGREARRSVAFIEAALDSIATQRAIKPR